MVWFKLDIDLFESDRMAGAILDSPYALQAAIWVFTRAAKKQAGDVEVGEAHVRGGAAKANITATAMQEGLDAIIEGGIVQRTEAGVTIPGWEKYQSDYLSRKSRLVKAGGEAVKVVQPAVPQEPATNAHSKSATKRTKRTTKRLTSPPSLPVGFDEFWLAYPAHRRVGKDKAVQAWMKLKGEDHEAAKIGLKAALTSRDWLKENGQYVPRVDRYLTDRRWEIPTTSSVTATIDDSVDFWGNAKVAETPVIAPVILNEEDSF